MSHSRDDGSLVIGLDKRTCVIGQTMIVDIKYKKERGINPLIYGAACLTCSTNLSKLGLRLATKVTT